MHLDRKRLLCTTVIAGMATAAWISSAAAQTGPAQPAAQSQATAQTPPKADSDASDVSELVVTGSRIKRNEFNSASPIQVIMPDQGTARGISDTVELLQTSPLASGSPQINSTISTAFVTDGGPGAATISLRGLGADRTLVLLNGRRAGPAGTRGAVSAFDLNVLPQSAIDHVEILKDGASSIYGSDAVAGVVNIITKKNSDGFNFDAFGSDAQHSGGSEYELSGSWGKTFDRGYFNVSVDYYKQFELRQGERDFTRCAAQYQFDAAGARSDVIDARTGKPDCLGTTYGQLYIYDYTFSGQQYTWKWPDLQHCCGYYVEREPVGGDLSSALMEAGKALPRRPDRLPEVPPPGTNVAWHIENRTFVAWLENACRREGVAFTDAELTGVERGGEGIERLHLSDGSERRPSV